MNKKECAFFLNQLFSHDVLDPEKRLLLLDYARKDLSVEEIGNFIQLLRAKMVPLFISNRDDLVDTCGTGGDGKQTFNISTAVAFVVAAAGAPVVKHGNRAASSMCGSADVLESLGVNIFLSPDDAKKIFESIGLVFLFAPLYHPHFKYIAAARKKLGIPTLFNLIGPFLNPAVPKRQLIGVSDVKTAQKMAIVASQLNYEHVLIISSYDCLDEISLSSPTKLFEIKNKSITDGILYPSDYGFRSTNLIDIKGGNAGKNSQIIKSALSGTQSACYDIVVLNSGVALYVAGKTKSITLGIQMARDTIQSGKANRLLQRLIIVSNNYDKYTG